MHNKNPTFLYRAATWILFPIAMLITLLIALKYRNGKYFCERFAIYSKPKNKQSSVWVHCASVGEINTVLPLLRIIIRQGNSILLTTNTITGLKTAQNADLSDCFCVFLPLDCGYCASKFLSEFGITTCILVETEFWPNILLLTHSRRIPIVIINGRISNKTLNAPAFLRENYRRVLQTVSAIAASSEENARRFVALGADANKVITLDNLKYGLVGDKESSYPRPLPFPYLLCVSTHANEEQQIILEWKSRNIQTLGLVIAPRHPKRCSEIVKVMHLADYEYALHSQTTTPLNMSSIYIIDTLGQLDPFMAHAEMVFVGGTLTPVGGHNVIEPAQFRRCIIIGPHYKNFTSIVEEFKQHKAIVLCENAAELVDNVERLFDDHQLRETISINAYQLTSKKQNIVEKYFELVCRYF